MKHYGFENPEGSSLKNITAPSGTAFPSGTENAGELFFRTDESKLYCYNGSGWVDLAASAVGISDIVSDTTPQLGGDLDLNGHNITGDATFTGVVTIEQASPAIKIIDTDNATAGYHTINTTGTNGQNFNISIDPTNEETNSKLNVWIDGTTVFTIANDGTLEAVTPTYENLVLDDNDIPNKKYVDDKVISGALQNVVEDTSPQLGGDLDVNGNSIISSLQGGNIAVVSGDNASGSAGSVIISTGFGTADNGTIEFNIGSTLALEIETDGTLSTNVVSYESLIVDNNDIPNKKYVDDAIDTAVDTAVTANPFVISGLIPTLKIIETDATADNKNWSLKANDEELYFQALTDADSGGGNVIAITRAAQQINTLEFRQAGVTWAKFDNVDKEVTITGSVWIDDPNVLFNLDDIVAPDGYAFKRITTNDGGGNLNIRNGIYYDGGFKYATAADGGAFLTLGGELATGDDHGTVTLGAYKANTGSAGDAAGNPTTRLSLRDVIRMSMDDTDVFKVDTDGTISAGDTVNYKDLVIDDNDIPNKAYVDAVAQGLSTRAAANAATTAAITATYSAGTGSPEIGIGSTLTGTSNGALPAQDGVTLGLNDRLLVKNQGGGSPDLSYQNGIYYLSQVGDAGNPFILTRCLCTDENDEVSGAYTFIQDGNTYQSTGWVLQVDDPTTFQIGTDAITAVQFSAAGSYTAGSNIDITGNAISVVDGSGSGLDADTVDGIEAASFLRSDTSDTAIGTLTFTNTVSLERANPFIQFVDTDGVVDDKTARLYWYENGFLFRSMYDNNTTKANILKLDDSAFLYLDNVIWHAGNDGSGSGLDADTVDGLEASQLVRGDAVDHAADVIIRVDDADFAVEDSTETTFKYIFRDHSAGLLYLGLEPSESVGTGAFLTFRSGVDFGGYDSYGMNFLTFTNSEPSQLTADGQVGFDSSRGLILYRTQHVGQESGDGGYTVLDTSNITGGTNIEITNTAANTAGTEAITFNVTQGSGSGLDADTVDGVEAADIAQLDVANIFTEDQAIRNTSPELKLQNTDVTGNSVIWFQDATGAVAGDAAIFYNPPGDFLREQVYTSNHTDLATYITQYRSGIITFGAGGSNGSNATEVMRINANGELQIGNATDLGDYKLQVTGDIYSTTNVRTNNYAMIGSDSGNGFHMEWDTTNSRFKHHLTYNDGGGNWNMRIGHIYSGGLVCTEASYPFAMVHNQTNGNMIFYTTSTAYAVNDSVAFNNTFTFAPTGDFTASGNVTAYSDIRHKTAIENIDNALDKVKAIRGVTYERIHGNKGEREAGVIAQEVEKVLPEVIREDGDGMKSVAYGNMVGLLIEAIKEQQEQIDALKAEVASLKGE